MRGREDCYECTRKATVEAKQVDPDTGRRLSIKEQIKDRTEECLRERGYIAAKRGPPMLMTETDTTNKKEG